VQAGIETGQGPARDQAAAIGDPHSRHREEYSARPGIARPSIEDEIERQVRASARQDVRCRLLLSSPTMPPRVRQDLEARILAGEFVGGPDIVRARGPLKNGRPRRPGQPPAMRMAA
jgi:hypothetical protein